MSLSQNFLNKKVDQILISNVVRIVTEFSGWFRYEIVDGKADTIIHLLKHLATRTVSLMT